MTQTTPVQEILDTRAVKRQAVRYHRRTVERSPSFDTCPFCCHPARLVSFSTSPGKVRAYMECARRACLARGPVFEGEIDNYGSIEHYAVNGWEMRV